MPEPLRKLLGMGFWTLLAATGVAFASHAVVTKVGLWPAFSLLACIILLNVAADIVGTAAAAAEEPPFHAMATHRVPGAREAIYLVRHADRVANVANDLLGDVFGTVGGAVGAAIVLRLVQQVHAPESLVNTLVLALIAAATVGGKAAAKSFAIRRANDVIFLLGRVLHRLTGGAGFVLPPAGRRRRSRAGRRRKSR